jgi:hypothetical protein
LPFISSDACEICTFHHTFLGPSPRLLSSSYASSNSKHRPPTTGLQRPPGRDHAFKRPTRRPLPVRPRHLQQENMAWAVGGYG